MLSLGRELRGRLNRYRARAAMCLTAVAIGLGGLPALAAVGGAWASPAWAGTVTVRPGQNLSQIAAQLHTSVAALVAANGLADPNRVLAGQLLEIPGIGSGAAPGTAVVVQPGQTLSAIASRYGVSLSALVAANRISNPNRVLAGARLVVPRAAGSGMALASYTVPSPGTGGLPAKLAANPGRLALRPAFVSAAARYGVPVSLLEALCWWESGWQSAIVSSTGAIGVCQIEPYTATFVDRYLAGAALNPQVAEQNIAIGAAFLSSLLRATAGDVGQAVAGYYQGLQSVRQHGMLPATANYVHGIEAYAAIFSG